MELTIVLVAVIVLLLWKVKPVKNVNTITTKELKTLLANKALVKDKVFLDVRTPREFAANKAKSFINIPLGSDFSKLPADKEIIVICQSGMRSLKACKQLKKLGYSKVTNVRGGMSNY